MGAAAWGPGDVTSGGEGCWDGGGGQSLGVANRLGPQGAAALRGPGRLVRGRTARTWPTRALAGLNAPHPQRLTPRGRRQQQQQQDQEQQVPRRGHGWAGGRTDGRTDRRTDTRTDGQVTVQPPPPRPERAAAYSPRPSGFRVSRPGGRGGRKRRRRAGGGGGRRPPAPGS